VEGYIAQVLQRRANHDTFLLDRVDVSDRPDLEAHFQIDTVPTLVVIESKRVQGRLPAPRGCREIERFLAPWLR
jgi:thioredoxin-like negative regulator of GroEL